RAARGRAEPWRAALPGASPLRASPLVSVGGGGAAVGTGEDGNDIDPHSSGGGSRCELGQQVGRSHRRAVRRVLCTFGALRRRGKRLFSLAGSGGSGEPSHRLLMNAPWPPGLPSPHNPLIPSSYSTS